MASGRLRAAVQGPVAVRSRTRRDPAAGGHPGGLAGRHRGRLPQPPGRARRRRLVGRGGVAGVPALPPTGRLAVDRPPTRRPAGPVPGGGGGAAALLRGPLRPAGGTGGGDGRRWGGGYPGRGRPRGSRAQPGGGRAVGAGPGPAGVPRSHRRHLAHEPLCPQWRRWSPAHAHHEVRLCPDTGAAAAPPLCRGLRLFTACRGPPSPGRPHRPRRHPVERPPRRSPHRGPGPGAGPGAEERGDRSDRGQGGLRLQAAGAPRQ